MNNFRCGNDPQVAATLSPEARAELIEFAGYLAQKADTKREGNPWPWTFETWRIARTKGIGQGAPNE